MSEHVRVENAGGVLSIALARPERRNAITVAMYAALADALEAAAADPAIRLIRISGDGQDFTAGNDLADFLSGPPRDVGEIPVWRMLRALASCATPILGQVHGNCVGIGTTMLLHCDLVVAEDGARF
ncbi:MAG: enoyl-CoA hydratase-related protein, partial [Sphingomicrobium sp.]